MAGLTLHVVSHSHWDREWYLPFELHRRRLVKLLDDLLDTLERDPAFGSFHLDGQSIPLEDYLEIRPHARARLAAAARAGRLTVGPWYVLQDEFLTSGEAQVRNMLYGSRLAAEFGPVLKVGYLADAFGNIGQMPQILAGFGIDNAVFGRGITRLKANASPDALDRGYPSELIWEGSDGTRILGIFMANWYSNAMDIPREREACLARFRAIREAALRFATTPHLLLMNGCDHTPCQLDISELLAMAREGLDDTVLHSRLDDYVAAVKASAGELPVARGELRSQYSDGKGTLTNVLSSRVYLKRANWRCQAALEQHYERWQAVLGALGGPVDRDLRRYLWKLLLQNHPHDSICGCSVDAVHDEMATRFAKVGNLAEQLITEDLANLAARIDTTCVDTRLGEVALVVFNPSGFARRAQVDADVYFADDVPCGSVQVFNAKGRRVKSFAAEAKPVWGYDLPDDRFRQPWQKQEVHVAFVAEVPAFGYAVYRVRPNAEPVALPEVREWRSNVRLQNEYLRVAFGYDGTLDIQDRETGRWWQGLNLLRLERDQGDEYSFVADPDKPAVGWHVEDRWYGKTPVAEEAHFSGYLAPDTPSLAEIIARYAFGADQDAREEFEDEGLVLDALEHPSDESWPDDEEFDEDFDEEDYDDDDLDDYDDEDSDEPRGTLGVEMHVSLAAGSRAVEVIVSLANHGVRDYRLRAHFPTDIDAQVVSADGQFEVVTRPVHPWAGWTHPDHCQPLADFVDLSDEAGGLTIATRGLHEYEVSRDGGGDLAITLLRGVGKLGDWGEFPTPDAQCPGAQAARYAIIPHSGLRGGSDVAARAFNTPLRYTQTDRHTGKLPATTSWIALSPDWLVLSAVRWAEDRDAFLVRLYNPYDEPVVAVLRLGLPWRLAWRCNLDEERTAALGPVGKELRVALRGKEIVTLELA